MTPTPNEIDAAADRLRANCWDGYLADPPDKRDWMAVFDRCLFDGRNVADAYLALTDPAPVTVEKLVAEGFVADGHWLVVSAGNNAICVLLDDEIWSTSQGHATPAPTCMGDVRTLLRQLRRRAGV